MEPNTLIAPIITGIVAGVFGIITTVLIVRGKRSDREPDVVDSWREADTARRGRVIWQDAFYIIRSALRRFAAYVASLGIDIPDYVTEALKLHPEKEEKEDATP